MSCCCCNKKPAEKASMIKKVIAILSGVPATVVSLLFLLLDFIPHLAKEMGRDASSLEFLPFHPSWVAVIISGIPLVYKAAMRLFTSPGVKKISAPLLITIAMVASILTDNIFAAGEVAFIMALGGILEDKTIARAKKGLKKLVSLAPMQARRIIDGKETLVPTAELRPGDIVRILPGETIPIDGSVISGESSIDQSAMTGESIPVDKTIGDCVYSGTINRFGALDIRTEKIAADSSLQKLIRLVKEADGKKAPMARIADTAASYLVPIALLTAVITFIVTKDIERAVTILVVFCPCALVLATPTAIMAAIGQATRHGVIIKRGDALEKMGKVTTIAFDKTGTLTHGKLEVSAVVTLDKTVAQDNLLALAASAEAKSEHPFAKAIAEYAAKQNITLSPSDEFRMTSGKGIYAIVDGKEIRCGNEAYLKDSGITIDADAEDKLATLRKEGKAAIIVAKGNYPIGIIALSDTLRSEAASTVAKLGEMKTEVILLTGDNQVTADYFAKQVGITKVKAGLLPENKVEAIAALEKSKAGICMVGDGINDAPALKAADIGIAMGGLGSDIAVEAADIVLMSDDISRLPYLKRLSLATVHTIKLGITLSMFINIAAVTASVLGMLTPTAGALIHNAGSCFVVLIAALLYDRKIATQSVAIEN